MLNKLLVALDGSELAECVLSYVETLGLQAKEVVLLQVIPTPHGRALREPVPQTVIDPITARSIHVSADPVRDLGMPHGDRVARDEGFLYQDKLMEEAEIEAKDYLSRISERLANKGFNLEPVVLFGNPASEIVDYASKIDADLIVISTHGRSGIGRWAFGNTADKVLRAAAVPVLLIRAGICPAT